MMKFSSQGEDLLGDGPNFCQATSGLKSKIWKKQDFAAYSFGYLYLPEASDQNYLMASKQDGPNRKEADSSQTTNRPTPVEHNLTEHQQQLNRVRRRLDFGCDESDDANQADAAPCLPLDVTQNDRQRAINKWNFDFENEVPLEGDWVWERVPIEPPEATQVVSSREKKQVENRSV